MLRWTGHDAEMDGFQDMKHPAPNHDVGMSWCPVNPLIWVWSSLRAPSTLWHEDGVGVVEGREGRHDDHTGPHQILGAKCHSMTQQEKRTIE